MNIELDREICEKYPKIFADRHAPMTETAMCWGFEHGDGWYQLVDELCNQIQNHIDWSHKTHQWTLEYNEKNPTANREVLEPVPQVVAEQIKEKLGSLRFYYRGGDDYISGLVSMAESVSKFICISCGGHGEIKNHNGWLSNVCLDCEKQQKDL